MVDVLTPSGTIYDCVGSSAECSVLGYNSTSAGGTFQCDVPFGGSVASLSSSATGGVSIYGGCSGNDSIAWTEATSNLCTGTQESPSQYLCVGAAGLSELSSVCTSGGFISGAVSNTQGDTSQPGIYEVLVCWSFVTTNPSSAAVVFSDVVSLGSFVIQSSSGVPQFPLGLMAIFAVGLPALMLVRAKVGISRARNQPQRLIA